MEDLMTSLPISAVGPLQVSLLWDRLYPSTEDFIIALVKGEYRAVARLVQVYGLYRGDKILGKSVWKKFEKYKQLIQPVRRRQCEKIWQHYQNPELI